MASAENVVLRLHYNVQPWVGLLSWDDLPGGLDALGRWERVRGGASKAFALPPVKSKDDDAKPPKKVAKPSP